MRWLVSVFPATTAAGYSRVDDAAGAGDDLDVAEAPAVQRDALVEQAREAVVDGRPRDGLRAVDAAGDLVVAAGEVDDRAVAARS